MFIVHLLFHSSMSEESTQTGKREEADSAEVLLAGGGEMILRKERQSHKQEAEVAAKMMKVWGHINFMWWGSGGAASLSCSMTEFKQWSNSGREIWQCGRHVWLAMWSGGERTLAFRMGSAMMASERPEGQ